MSLITWLHISDLQCRTAHSGDAQAVCQGLLDDVAGQIERQGLRLDFVALTGDVAYAGQPAEYALAGQFLHELLSAAGLDRSRLFVVPGDHDVDLERVTPGARSIGEFLNDRATTNAILASPIDRRLLFARFAGYAAFAGDCLDKTQRFDPDHYFYTHSLLLGGQRVALLGLNSAWLSAPDHDEARKGTLGERQVEIALEQVQNADLRIALVHHPPARLRSFDRQAVEPLLRYGCNFVLHGPAEPGAAANLKARQGEALAIAAGAGHGYNLVQIDLVTGQGTVILRQYDRDRGRWEPDRRQPNAPEGCYHFSLNGRVSLDDRASRDSREGADTSPPSMRREEPTVWPPGTVLDSKYEVTELIEATTHCEIYRAQELHYARQAVAIKRLKPDRVLVQDQANLKEVHERFEQEIAILRHLDHPCVLRLLDEGGDIGQGDRYFVTQFADQGGLNRYLQAQPGRRLDLAQALEMALAICRAIGVIHSLGIIHRDIKPSNILLFSRAGGYDIKLADFSIAKVPKTWLADGTITQADVFMGSFLYSAPEQFASELDNPRSDLYAWAAVFFEMLTGHSLVKSFTQETSTETSFLALLQYYRSPGHGEFPLSFFAERGIPPELGEILQKALRRDPARRYNSAEEVETDLLQARQRLVGPVAAQAESPRPFAGAGTEALAPGRAGRRRIWPLAALLLFAALSLSLLAYGLGVPGLGREATATPSPTPSPSLAPGAATAATATTSPDPTTTETATATATASATSSGTPTEAPTASQTPTASPSLTATRTATATASPTPTRTATATATPAATQTQTETPAPTPTEEPPPTQTEVPTREPTPIPTQAPTATQRPRPTPTWTRPPLPGPTPTWTQPALPGG
jgi:serine/threonine protein kinase